MASSGTRSSSGEKEHVLDMFVTPVVAVLGTGMYGRALANLLGQHGGLDVRLGSRNPVENQVTHSDAVHNASVVFLAIPPSAHEALLKTIAPKLNPDALLVDISNHPLNAPPSRNATTSVAERLQSIAPPGIFVAKAFNTLSSYHLEDRRTSHTIRIACDDMDSVDKLSKVCVKAGLTPVYEGDLSTSRHLEALPHVLFPKWRLTLCVSTIVVLWWLLYNTLVKFVIPTGSDPPATFRPWKGYPLEIFMSVSAEAAMTMFTITFLPGPIAGFVQLFRRSASKPFGKFFGTWLDARKELGLAAFFFAGWHAISGTILRPLLTPESEWKEYAYFTLGIISYSLFALLAVGSSPGVSKTMTWKEYRALFSWVGTLGLVFGVLHQGFWGWAVHKYRPNPSLWAASGALLPSYWLGIILPLLALLLRFLTWSPCMVFPLRKLRNEVPLDLEKSS